MFGIFVLFALLCFVPFVQNQNKSGLVLLGQLENGELDLRCVTTEVDKALTWNTPTEKKFILIDTKYINSNKFIPNGWPSESSLKSNFGPILDERWEGLSIKYTNSDKTMVFEKLDRLNSFSNTIPISVKLKAEGHIYICKHKYASPPINDCYWIILGGWNGTRSVLRKCPRNQIKYEDVSPLGNCNVNLVQNRDNKLSEKKWKHFTVFLDNVTKSISVIFEGDDTPFLYYQDDNLVDEIGEVYVNSRSGNGGFWKLHDYDVYAVRGQEMNKEHLLFSILPIENSLSLSMYISICETCTIALYLKHNQSDYLIYEEKYSKKKGSIWQKIKFCTLELESSVEYYQLYMKVMGALRDRDQIVLSFIQISTKCFHNEIKYSVMRIDPNDQERVSCQYLLNGPMDKEIKIQEPSLLTENPCKPEEVIYKETKCKQTIVCENGKCHCSQGYEGYLCNFPLGNVGNITWNSTDTTISLQWKPPTKTNGKMVEYIVSYQMVLCEICPMLFNNNSCDEIKTTNTKIILENLNPFSEYFVRIGPFTELPEKIVEKRITTKPSDELNKDAFNIRITEINITVITLHIKPNCENINGPVKIAVILTCSQYWCNKTSNETIDPFAVTYSLQHLHAFTEYNLKLILFNSVKSIDIFTETVTTKPGIPNAVTNFEVYEKSENSVLIRWTPPKPPTGIIEKYSVSARFWMDHPIDVEVHSCKVWTNMMCAEFIDVSVRHEWQEHEILIRAKNKNVDTWSSSTITDAVPGVTAPESPKILNAMWDNGFNFTLRWQHPDKTNGRLTNFIIKRNSKNINNFEVVEYNLTYETTQVVYPDSPTYIYEIYAVNIAFDSPASTILVHNPPKRPTINEPISYKEQMNNLIKILIPVPIDIEYLSFTYVILSEPGTKDCNKSGSVSEFMNHFEECKVWFAKEIVSKRKKEEIVIGDMTSQHSYRLNEIIINRAINPYTKYNVFVMVINENNNFKRFSITKAMSVFLEPTKVILPCYTSCKIRFNARKYHQSSINFFLVQYKEINQKSWANTSALRFLNNFEILNMFKKATNYILRINLIKGEELELQMPELNFTTSCRNVHLENITTIVSNVSAELSLNCGYQKEICNLDNYNLIVLIPGHEYNKTLKANNIIEFLQPVTTYNVSISGEKYNLFTNFTTDEGSPQKVVNVTWNSTDTTISLHWQEPTVTNGKIVGYHVYYQHALYKSCIFIETDDKSSGKNTTSTTNILLNNLNPNSKYTVLISAFTKLAGNLVETQVSTKPGDELDKGAYMISVNEYGTTIGLHFWPNCKKIKAPVQISVIITCLQNWCNKTTNITIDPLLISYTLQGLLPFTKYYMKFILVNSVQSIDLFTKTVTTLTTESGIPGPVKYFEAYGRPGNSILMRWKPAEPPTGIIEKYFFSAEYYKDGIWTDCTIKESNTFRCKSWSDMMCVVIKGVMKELRYRITITAKHKTVDKRSNPVTTEVSVMEEKQSNTIYVCLFLLLLLLLPMGQIYARYICRSTGPGMSRNETSTDLDDSISL